MANRIFKLIIGILLLPFLISVSIAFYEQFGNIETTWTKSQQYFIWGIIAYCLIHLLLFKPMLIYAIGHEVVHVLATLLCLGKVTSFKISRAGGSVSTSKSNLFITLSPYIIPIYVIFLIVLYYLINNVFFEGILAQSYFMFLLGMTLAFHIVMTVDMLKTKQPDFVKAGYLVSFILIYVINLLFVAGTLGLLFEGFYFRSFLNDAYFSSIDLYRSIFKQLFLFDSSQLNRANL